MTNIKKWVVRWASVNMYRTHFIQSIKGSQFGVVMIEEEPGKLCIGLRSKTGLDISIFAKKLGGGGHLYRAGATVYGKDFETNASNCFNPQHVLQI